MFQQLIELQCWGVFLFQPALMAGVLTYEKERDSFSLLLLTGMSPTKILVEKYFAGLFPMVTLLLLALPLGAITMGYGGVSPQVLASGACVVLAAWLQAGAFALLCSAWCRTTVGAILCAYLGGALVLLAPAIAYSLGVRYVLWGADLRALDVPAWLWSLWAPEVFARVLAFHESVPTIVGNETGARWMRLLGETGRLCAPMLISAGVCLLLARLVMVRRALVGGDGAGRAGPGLKSRFSPQAIMQRFHTLWPRHTSLPTNDPVAWRESGRGLLGQEGRFALFTFAATGVTFFTSALLLGLYPRTAGPERLHHFSIVLGAVAVLVLTVRSVGALLSEHANQTLDILLTTPLGAAEILREKARALGRYWLIFALMLGVVFLPAGWSEYEYLPAVTKWQLAIKNWICSGLALLIYPPLIIWTSLFLALWLRARAKATIVALLFFAGWFIVPRLVLSIGWPSWSSDRYGFWLSLLSPAGILDANRTGQLDDYSLQFEGSSFWNTDYRRPWVIIACNFLGYGLLLAFVRWLCLRMADRWMRRSGR
jgi:hypothetical protein